MKIKERPNLTVKFAAIDGIKKNQVPSKEQIQKMIKENPLEQYYFTPAEEAVRPDVQGILEMEDIVFDAWYRQKKSGILGLLNKYRLIKDIPDLNYGSKRCTLNCHSSISGTLESLERGLEYVEIIKKIREEDKEI